MRLESIEITNFRCFGQLTLETKGDSLMMVSENAIGKSSILAAIAKALGKDKTIAPTDFADINQAIEIVATLSGFDRSDSGTFPRELSFAGRPTLRIGMRAVWDISENDCEVTVGFPDRAWARAIRAQREALPVLWLPAFREPGRILQLAATRSILAQLVSCLNLVTATDTATNDISVTLDTLSKTPEIVSLLQDARAKLAGLIPGVDTDAFSLGTANLTTNELLQNFELFLTHNSATLPVGRQSNGLGQLSIFVFAIKLLLQNPKALLLVDEPEISLHPQAQRALSSAIRALPNQSLIATHSSNILDRANAKTIIRLHRAGTTVLSSRATALTDPEAEQLAKFVNPQTMEACFARKIILVEGYSDRIAIIRLAQRLGKDLDAQGVSVLSLQGGNAIGPHLKLLGSAGLGIEVLGLCDEDKEIKWKKELGKAGIAVTDRTSMISKGFLVCVKDLEHEFIRVLGPAKVQALIAREGEATAFALFQKQPDYTSQPLDEQLRRYLHNDAIRWAVSLVDELDLTAIPGPLKDLLSRL